jgi:hypothetical protein
MGTSSPVFGFLPSLGALLTMEKLPKPANVTRSPSCIASAMEESSPFNPFSAATLLIRADLAMDSIRSFLFIVYLLHLFPGTSELLPGLQTLFVKKDSTGDGQKNNWGNYQFFNRYFYLYPLRCRKK